MTDTPYSTMVASATNFFDYAARHELALLKLHIGSKRPVGETWQNLSSTNPIEWALWKTLSFNIGVDARMSRLVIVDPDAADGKKGLQNWEAWCRSKGLNLDDYAPHVATARDGRHIFFRIPDGVAVSGASERIQDVDIIVKGQTVAPGSYFDGTAEGKQSGWYMMLSEAPPHPMPDALLALCTRKPRKEAGPGSGDFSFADMARRCTHLAEVDGLSDEFEWIKGIWALRSAFGDAGWPLAEKISYADDKDRLDGVWAREDSSKENPQTCATLIKLSNDLGYREWHHKHMFDDVVAQLAANAGATIAQPSPDDMAKFAEDMRTGRIPRPDAAAEEIEPDTPLRDRRINAASLEGKPVPEREWLVRDLIPAKNVTLLYGDGGTGKSLLALQLGAAVVTGKPFFGHAVTQGRVEFITAEDSLDEMHRRLFDIARATGTPLGGLSGLHLTSLAETDAMLAVAPDSRGGALAFTALYNELESVIAETRPALVTLDTLADVFGGNEIIRAQARQFIGMLRRLCLLYDCTIVVLAHPSLAGMEKGTSGSTGWGNSVRSRLYFKRVCDEKGQEADEDARVLSVGKSNYGRVGLEIPMQWRAGVFASTGGSGGDPMVSAAKAERVFLELLAQARANNINVHVTTGHGYAPDVFKTDAVKQGVSKRALEEAMRRLMNESKKIENVMYGAPSRGTSRLQIVGGA
jgi:RecA-family ATPase